MRLRISVPILLVLAMLISETVWARQKNALKYDTTLYRSLQWREIGPFRGGRSIAVAGHRNQPWTYYFGATGGGVWKTDDGGVTWLNVSDGFFKVGIIGQEAFQYRFGFQEFLPDEVHIAAAFNCNSV